MDVLIITEKKTSKKCIIDETLFIWAAMSKVSKITSFYLETLSFPGDDNDFPDLWFQLENVDNKVVLKL